MTTDNGTTTMTWIRDVMQTPKETLYTDQDKGQYTDHNGQYKQITTDNTHRYNGQYTQSTTDKEEQSSEGTKKDKEET